MAQFDIYPNPGTAEIHYRRRLKSPAAKLSAEDRAKIRPAIDKVIGEY